jgi:Protein of unknown function (DUF3102)
MTAQKKTEDNPILNQLAINIQAGHRRCIDGVKGLIAQAKCNGDWLNEAKKLVPHNRWTGWVEDHCHFKLRMAHKYRHVAKHYDALIARFNTEDEWTLTMFFTEASMLEAKARSEKKGTQPATSETEKKAPAGCKSAASGRCFEVSASVPW